jgi:tetratricopeptide (TPR) repeat protein
LGRFAIAAGVGTLAISAFIMGCGPKPGVPPTSDTLPDEDQQVITVEERMDVALAYMDQGRVGDAAEHYRHILDEEPDNFEANLNLGLALMTIEDAEYRNQRDYTETRQRLIAARSLRGDDARPHTCLGTLDFEAGQYSDAITHLSKANTLDPGNEAINEMLGVSLIKVGRPQAGLTALARALEVNPDNAVANLEMGKAYEAENKNQLAMRHLERALGTNPNLDMALWVLERVYYEEGLDQRAEEACRRFLEFHPEDIQSLEILGWIYKRQGQIQQMLETYEALAKIAPENTSYWSPLVQHYMDANDHEKARGILEDALRHNPYYAYGNIRYGQVLIHYGDRVLETGSRQEALRLFSQARQHLERAKVDDRYAAAASQLIDRVESRIREASK